MDFFEIIIISIATIVFATAIFIFFFKLFTQNFKNIKKMLKTPTSLFVFLTLLLIGINYFVKNLFYNLIFIPILIVAPAIVLISRSINLFLLKFRMGFFSWILIFLGGVGSFCTFLIIIGFLSPIHNEFKNTSYEALGYFYFFTYSGIITCIISLIINIWDKKSFNKKSQSEKEVS